MKVKMSPELQEALNATKENRELQAEGLAMVGKVDRGEVPLDDAFSEMMSLSHKIERSIARCVKANKALNALTDTQLETLVRATSSGRTN
jgi:hypothetical protein